MSKRKRLVLIWLVMGILVLTSLVHSGVVAPTAPSVVTPDPLVLEYYTIGENYIFFTISGVAPGSILELEGKEHKAGVAGTISLDGPRDRFFQMETFKIDGIIYRRLPEGGSYIDQYNHEVYQKWLVPATNVP